MKPKCHWMMDVAEQIEDTNVVFDLFIIERLHLKKQNKDKRTIN